MCRPLNMAHTKYVLLWQILHFVEQSNHSKGEGGRAGFYNVDKAARILTDDAV